MKILHLGKYFYPETGGIENYTFVLSSEAKKLKYDVYVIVSNTSKKLKYEKINGIKVFRLPRILYLFHTPITIPFVCLIKKIDPDIIHLHVPNPWFEFNLFIYSLINRNKKIIITYHSDIICYTLFHLLGENFRRLYFLPLLKISKKIVATSRNYIEHSTILKKFKKKIKIIPLGIDTEKFKPIKIKKLRKKVLLFTGRLFPYKGLEYLLQAIKIVSKKRNDFVLFIIGEGILRKKLEKMSKILGITSFVKFKGKVSDKEIIKYYNLCDIFVLPSIYKSEAFGISQLEAMACAKPVISTKLKGSAIPWINQHMKTGILVEPRNANTLAKAIIFLLENENMRKKMGKMARERVINYFTIEKMIEKTFRIYNSLTRF